MQCRKGMGMREVFLLGQQRQNTLPPIPLPAPPFVRRECVNAIRDMDTHYGDDGDDQNRTVPLSITPPPPFPAPLRSVEGL